MLPRWCHWCRFFAALATPTPFRWYTFHYWPLPLHIDTLLSLDADSLIFTFFLRHIRHCLLRCRLISFHTLPHIVSLILHCYFSIRFSLIIAIDYIDWADRCTLPTPLRHSPLRYRRYISLLPHFINCITLIDIEPYGYGWLLLSFTLIRMPLPCHSWFSSSTLDVIAGHWFTPCCHCRCHAIADAPLLHYWYFHWLIATATLYAIADITPCLATHWPFIDTHTAFAIALIRPDIIIIFIKPLRHYCYYFTPLRLLPLIFILPPLISSLRHYAFDIFIIIIIDIISYYDTLILFRAFIADIAIDDSWCLLISCHYYWCCHYLITLPLAMIVAAFSWFMPLLTPHLRHYFRCWYAATLLPADIAADLAIIITLLTPLLTLDAAMLYTYFHYTAYFAARSHAITLRHALRHCFLFHFFFFLITLINLAIRH